jgi:UDP-galactopyranose mutase
VPREILCFSHLRWDFVYQRPNHLMARAARSRRVFYVEEPLEGPEARLEITRRDGVHVVIPRLPSGLNGDRDATLRRLLSEFVARERIARPVLWYYTPMAGAWTDHLPASAVVYDVMDELSNFRFAPADIRDQDQRLLRRADVVLTGGRQLYESRRGRHPNVHLFPSSVDVAHFGKARDGLAEPADQAGIPHPRIGYFGVIDERIDLDLVRDMAARHLDWQIVLVGPTAKIDPADIPAAPNVHHLGLKSYQELPAYLGGWDVAMMPFALNDATRFISPTKTPEYLAGGRPVASTPITDVVEPYGRNGLVEIGEGSDGFISAVERALATEATVLRRAADGFLVEAAIARNEVAAPVEAPSRVVPADKRRPLAAVASSRGTSREAWK